MYLVENQAFKLNQVAGAVAPGKVDDRNEEDQADDKHDNGRNGQVQCT